MAGTIIVDANILIFGEVVDSPEHPQALRKYNDAVQRGLLGINVVIVSETFHMLQRLFGSMIAASRIEAILASPAIEFLELGQDTVVRAAKLARDFGLRINDALIAQQAIEEDAAVLTDNVKDFGKIKAIKVIPLRTM